MFLTECIVDFFGSKMSCKGPIMVFLQKFHLKNLNFKYLQNFFFVKELFTLYPVAKIVI